MSIARKFGILDRMEGWLSRDDRHEIFFRNGRSPCRGRCCSNKGKDETADRDWLGTSSRKRACLLSYFSTTGLSIHMHTGSFITRSMADVSSDTIHWQNRSSSFRWTRMRLTFEFLLPRLSLTLPVCRFHFLFGTHFQSTRFSHWRAV